MWILARIYYYSEGKEALLLKCIRPLLQELQQQGLVDQGYFMRHWYRGSHIRLYLRTKLENRRKVQSIVAGVTSTYFSLHPSRRIVREEDVRATHERLAEVEKVTGPLFPLQPDNSIQFEDTDFNAELYGGEIGLKLANFFYSSSTPIVFDLLERAVQDHTVLLPQIFNWMLITASHFSGGLSLSYISYRSHSEGFLYGFDGKGKIRHHFERQYKKYADLWHQNVRHYLHPSYKPVNELDAAWNEMLETFLPYLRHAITDQNLLLPVPVFNLSRMSVFHQESFKYPWMEAFIASHHYTIRRLQLNLLYEVMLQAGIRPIEKMFLCYSVARSVEEVTGVSWQEFQQSHDEILSTHDMRWGKSVAWQEA